MWKHGSDDKKHVSTYFGLFNFILFASMKDLGKACKGVGWSTLTPTL